MIPKVLKEKKKQNLPINNSSILYPAKTYFTNEGK
jgi:hypothetical protein